MKADAHLYRFFLCFRLSPAPRVWHMAHVRWQLMEVGPIPEATMSAEVGWLGLGLVKSRFLPEAAAFLFVHFGLVVDIFYRCAPLTFLTI